MADIDHAVWEIVHAVGHTQDNLLTEVASMDSPRTLPWEIQVDDAKNRQGKEESNGGRIVDHHEKPSFEADSSRNMGQKGFQYAFAPCWADLEEGMGGIQVVHLANL